MIVTLLLLLPLLLLLLLLQACKAAAAFGAGSLPPGVSFPRHDTCFTCCCCCCRPVKLLRLEMVLFYQVFHIKDTTPATAAAAAATAGL
jgi:hypothetical protein